VDLPQLVQVLYTENIIGTEMEVLRGRTAAVAVIDSMGLRARLEAPRRGRITSLFSTLKVSPATDSGTFVFRSRTDGTFGVSRPQSSQVLGIVRAGDTTRIAGVLFALGPAARGVPEITLRIDPLQDAIRRFGSALVISRPSRDADLIAIHARMADPMQAAAVANLVAANLIADRRASHRGSTGTAVTFLEQQDDSLGRQLRAAEDSLRAYRQRAHVIDVPQQASAEVTRLAKLQADLAGVRAERDAFASLVLQFRQDTAANTLSEQGVSRRLMAFPSLLSNQSASVLLGALAQAEGERAKLLIRRTPADSDVQVLTRRTREIETQLQGIAESYLQSLSNQVTSLEGEAGKFGRQLDVLPEKELQTARLERDAKVLNDLWVLVRTRLKEAQVSGAAGDPGVRLTDAAAEPTQPIRPRPLANLALALLFGTVVGLSASMVREIGDRSVRSRGDALAAGGLPVVGALPRMRLRARAMSRVLASGRGGRLKASERSLTPERARTAASIASQLVTQPATPPEYTESLNQLFANLALTHRERPVKVIVFTSPLPGEGKTLSAINFALVGAARGLRVLLIDADLRCGVISTALGVRRAPGLADLLGGSAKVDETVHLVPFGDDRSLFVMPSGALPQLPGRTLTIERIGETLASVAPNFDLVVIDTPPINLLADAGLLGAVADAVLLVVRAGHTQSSDLRYAMDQLEVMRAPVLGTLLNDIDLRRNTRDDGSYRYLVEAGRYYVGAR
jgi:capsular exopolysaccharide synthesis family protein